MSSSRSRPRGGRRKRKARPWPTTSPISSCMGCCIFSVMITRPTARPRRWKVSKSAFWRGSASPILTPVRRWASEWWWARPAPKSLFVHEASAKGPRPLALMLLEPRRTMSEDRSSSEEARPAPHGRDGEHESWIERLLTGLRLKAGPSIREDLADALDTNLPGGEFTPIERSLLKNVLSLRELRVNDVMVPRADIVAVQASATLASVLHLFRTAGHSRIPAYGGNLAAPLGMVPIRDFVDYIAARAETAGRERLRRNVGRGRGDAPAEVQAQAMRLGVDLEAPLSRASILRPVLFVPPSMPAMDLLVKMQTTRTH